MSTIGEQNDQYLRGELRNILRYGTSHGTRDEITRNRLNRFYEAATFHYLDEPLNRANIRNIIESGDWRGRGGQDTRRT